MSETAFGTPAAEAGRAGPASKRDNFVRLAERRTIKSIKAIRSLAKLGNRKAYDYNDADVAKIVKALSGEIEDLKKRMTTTESSGGVDFRL